LKAFLIAAVVGVASSAGLAQTVYLPVQYQHGTENRKFYYAGSDPIILRRGAYYGPRTVENEPLRVYSDRFPHINAARYGYTIDDVRNEAYAQVPRYFTMRREAEIRR
jgi:hypothetical protein